MHTTDPFRIVGSVEAERTFPHRNVVLVLEVSNASSLRVDDSGVVESGALRQSFPERLGRLVVGRCCVTNDISFDCFEETDAEPGPHHKGAHGCVCSELRCAF